jgi:hypothetical protein
MSIEKIYTTDTYQGKKDFSSVIKELKKIDEKNKEDNTNIFLEISI